MSRLRNFIDSPFQKKKLIIHCLSLLWVFRIGLWCLPFRWINRFSSAGDGVVSEGETNWKEVKEIADTIRACSRFVPVGTCLTQAFAARQVLRRYGQHTDITIGVNNEGDSGFQAHAWITVEGKVIVGEHPDRKRFVVLGQSDLTNS